MNWNWGKGLTLFIIAFIVVMLGMVFIAFRQSNEMIEDNYYDREVRYQQTIDAKSRLRPLLGEFMLVDSNDFIWLKLPSSASDKLKNGELRWIKMDCAAADNTVAITQMETKMNKSQFRKGEYHVKLSWNNDEKAYFYEGDFTIR